MKTDRRSAWKPVGRKGFEFSYCLSKIHGGTANGTNDKALVERRKVRGGALDHDYRSQPGRTPYRP